MTVFMQGLVDGPVRNHLLHLELKTFEEEILDAEQKNCGMIEAHARSISCLPTRRQITGGSEPMDTCYVESERPRSSNNKPLQKCNRCQKLEHYAYECSSPRTVPNCTDQNDRLFAKNGNGR